jgi:hypothetical protein
MKQLLVLLLAWLGTILSCVAVATAQATASGEKDAETVIFRKPLEDRGEVVVVRGPGRPLRDVVGLIPDKALYSMKVVFWVRAEFRAPGMAPLPLAMELQIQGDTPGTFDILDVMTPPTQFDDATPERGLLRLERAGIVFAVAGGSGVWIWDVNAPMGGGRDAGLEGWSALAGAKQLDHAQVNAKLRRNSDALVEVEVTDLRSGEGPYHSRFVQSGKDVWEFKLVEQDKRPGDK